MNSIWRITTSKTKHLCRSFSLSMQHFLEIDSLPAIYAKYSEMKGGSVDLCQNEQTGIAVVTLNQPERKNAMSGYMMCNLADIVKNLECWKDGKGVIVHGRGRTFCSGGDLNWVKNNLTEKDGLEMSLFMHDILSRFQRLPLISTALLEGTALGGGAELATACDFRVMTEKARVGFVQTRMGVTTGWGGGTRLVKIIGKKNALKLLSTARMIDAQECKRIGFIDEVIPDSDCTLELTQKWAEQFCKMDSSLSQKVKSIVTYADELHMDSSLEKERLIFKDTWSSKLHCAAVDKNIKH